MQPGAAGRNAVGVGLGLLGCPLAERVTGVDLVPRLAELPRARDMEFFCWAAKGMWPSGLRNFWGETIRGAHRGHVFTH